MSLGQRQELAARSANFHPTSAGKNTIGACSSQVWVIDLYRLLVAAEEAEYSLSYLNLSDTEDARRLSGSYYTPEDVSLFFWREFFNRHAISDAASASTFLRTHRFVEPSVGSGALFFALLYSLALLGVSPNELAGIRVSLVDVNDRALQFIEDRITHLSQIWQVTLPNVQFVNGDFLATSLADSDKPLVIFGNPPFINKRAKASGWKNSFADFVEAALRHIGPSGLLHFIVPMSIAFSRDYAKLRKMLQEHPREIALSHFDNIPDTLFKAGKPAHEANTANSQRCSILTVRPAPQPSIYSTQLHRWSRFDRNAFLSQSPTYIDVTHYEFDNQIPRPTNHFILNYLVQCKNWIRFGDLLHLDGKFELHVGSVARNFIAVRDGPGSGNITLKFRAKQDFYHALLLLTSDLFFDYWRTVGDGFHLTKATIYDFPLSPELLKVLAVEEEMAKRLWSTRKSAQKIKLNAGKPICSYDFSALTPALIPRL